MKIISLAPFLTELVCHYGLEQDLIGVSSFCDYPASVSKLPRFSIHDPTAILTAAPDVVLASAEPLTMTELEALKRSFENSGIKLYSHWPLTLNDVFDMYQRLAHQLKVEKEGLKLSNRIKLQVISWCDNFYDRIRHKRVTIISGIDPLQLAARWVPDMVHMAYGLSQVPAEEHEDKFAQWKDIVAFKPDVIIVAPRDCSLLESARSFEYFETLPHWDDVPACKRGEVFFTDGLWHFYRPGPRMMESMGTLISTMGGVDSGYITERDSFYRLRWVELQRHRLK